MWALLLIILPIMTICGNFLIVISIYKERSLRNATNFFIVSLACADILVGLLVMPLAVYVEIEQGVWSLGDLLCDAWIAADVMASTASILHLMAISIDRYYAVTKPFEYRKQSTMTRVYITIVLAWAISITIAFPIVIGQNYSEERIKSPKLCIFYNSMFIIFSSVGSFYAPCVVIFVLYGKIFYILKKRQRQKQKLKKETSACLISEKYDNLEAKTDLSPVKENECIDFQIGNSKSQQNIKFLVVNDSDTVDSIGVSDVTMLPSINKELPSEYENNVSNFSLRPADQSKLGEVIGSSQNEVTGSSEPFIKIDENNEKKIKKYRTKYLSRLDITNKISTSLTKIESKAKNKTILREKKITITLAVVLGVFLLCWIPFFTANNVHAFCTLLKAAENSFCNIDKSLMSLFVWLGYINSSVNPLIYTIFNAEFRKVFHRILTSCNIFNNQHFII